MIIKVIIKCYKSEVNLLELATLLDTVLQQRGYDVHEVSTTIAEENDADKDDT